MAYATVLSDGLFVCGRVILIVAAEAALIIGMAQVVRICPPGNLEVREHVLPVDREQRLSRGLNVLGTLACNIRIFLPIEIGQARRNLLSGLFIGPISCPDQCDAGLLNKGKAAGDTARSDGVIDRAVRNRERVRRPVVTIHALHFERRKRAGGIGLGTAREIGSPGARLSVAVFDPGDGLALLVRGGIADSHAWSHVRTMDAAESSAAH